MCKNFILFLAIFFVLNLSNILRASHEYPIEIIIDPGSIEGSDTTTKCSCFSSIREKFFCCCNTSLEDQENNLEQQEDRFSKLWELRKQWIKRLHFLGSPRTAIGVTVAFGLSAGISNFLWAFNWVEHAGASEEAAAIIQEIGGLSASAECFLLGAAAPLIFYFYNKRAQALEDEINAHGDT